MGPYPDFPAHRAIKLLGEGANSQVFLGESLIDGDLRALKVYRGHSGGEQRFLAELQALTEVTHSHIVKLLEFGYTLDSRQDYLGLEYLDGRDFVSGTRDLSQDNFVSLVLQTLAALDLLHRKGFSHGDLTPAHLVVLAAERSPFDPPAVKLIDFSSSYSAATPSTTLSEGTLGYVAPEVLRGGRPTSASDLYSFGAILYECLSGEQPFRGSTPARVAQKQIQGDLRPLEGPSLRELHQLIQRLLSSDPMRRPSSAGEVIRLISDARPRQPRSADISDISTALAESGRLLGRDEYLKEASEIISQQATSPHNAPPATVFLMGEKGGGKTRFVKEIACTARLHGSPVIMMSGSFERGAPGFLRPPPGCEPGQSPPPPQIYCLDGFIGSDLESLSRIQALITHAPSRSIYFVSVNTSTTPRIVIDAAIELSRKGSHVPQWILRPLTREQIQSLATHSLPAHSLDTALVRFLEAQSGGNPLLVVELIRTLAPHSAQASARPAPLTPCDTDAWAPNGALLAIARQRIDHLSQEEQKISRLVAIADDRLSMMALASLTGMSVRWVEPIIRALTSRGVLRSGIAESQETFSMAGMIVGTQLLATVSADESHQLHEDLAAFYLSTGTQSYSPARAAKHLVAAGRIAEGVVHYVTAARHAMKAHDHVAARTFLQTALSLPMPDHLLRAELETLQADNLITLGHSMDASKLLQPIVDDDSLPDSLRADANIMLGHAARQTGDFRTQERAGRRAIALAEKAGDEHRSVRAHHLLGSALCGREPSRQGHRLLFRTARHARILGARGIVAGVMKDLAFAAWKSGKYPSALRYIRRRVAVLKTANDSIGVSDSLQHQAIIQTTVGTYSNARRTLRHSLSVARQYSGDGQIAGNLANIGEAYRAQGHWRQALASHRAALIVADSVRWPHAVVILRANIALISSHIGYPGEALRVLRHSLDGRYRPDAAFDLSSLYQCWSRFLVSIGKLTLAHRVASKACALVASSGLFQKMLESRVNMSVSVYGLGKLDEAIGLLKDSIDQYSTHAPFDVRLSASLLLVQLTHAGGAAPQEVEQALAPLIETARRKKMRWHLATGLLIQGEALIAANRADQAESILVEAFGVARKIADRTLYWQAAYLLGRACEQMLRYKRAIAFYRMSALTIHELGMNIAEERYRESFMDQPKVREVLARHERLRAEVGKQARRDLAVANRSEMVSRRMLGALSAIGQRLASILDLEELMTSILDLAIENVRAERGLIFLRDEVTGELRPASSRNIDTEMIEEVSSYSGTVIRHVALGQTLLMVDVGQDPALSAAKSIVLNNIKSILCVPMRARGKVAGVIYLDTQRGPQFFTDKERAFVESFASQAAIAIENARLFGLMSAENARLKREAQDRGRFDKLIGTSAAMSRLREVLGGVLDSDCNVLIAGESGTGKELVARAIHYNGPRQKQKFVAIDCGALPENLLEAELFGYARGAFTGADRDRVGLIEEAHGGTLFLDEITNTSPAIQAKLLRVLQEHEVRRLGENRPRRVDARVLAATNADLASLIEQGRFRQDLYYRLNVVTIEVPALRDRREDIPLLAAHFLRALDSGGPSAKRLGPGVLELLSAHYWPGNVRELENVIERASILAPGKVISVDDLPVSIRPPAITSGTGRDRTSHDRLAGRKTGEQLMIEESLRRCAGDKAKAARLIGWNRQKLYRRIKEYGIPPGYGKAA